MMKTKKIKLKIKGMSCHHCEMSVKRAIETINNLKVLKIDHKKGEAIIEINESEFNKSIEDAIIKAVEDAGYQSYIN